MFILLKYWNKKVIWLIFYRGHKVFSTPPPGMTSHPPPGMPPMPDFALPPPGMPPPNLPPPGIVNYEIYIREVL